MEVKKTMLVSPHIDSIILGLRWIEENIRSWNFAEKWVQLRGKHVSVHVRPEAGRCRRIAVATDAVIPPLSESEVDAYAVLPNLEAIKSAWATQPTLLSSGLIVAGNVLPDRETNLTLRVLNPTEKVI